MPYNAQPKKEDIARLQEDMERRQEYGNSRIPDRFEAEIPPTRRPDARERVIKIKE